LAGAVLNIILSAVKLSLGHLGGSSALIADGVHSLSDLSTDLTVLFGIKYWSAPPDKSHPYGHQRIETIITIVIGISLLLIGAGLGYEAVLNVRRMKVCQPDAVALAGALASIVVKELMFRKMYSTGKRLNSPAVKANSKHNRSDAISSIPVALAITIAMIKPEWAYIDSVGAIIVSTFIIYSSWSIIKPALFELSESGASDEILDRIEKTTHALYEIKSVHAVRTRKMGGEVLVDLHIEVDAELTVKQGHEIAAKVKRKLLSEISVLTDVIVHIEPYTP
jgi:cation diffusion facilitator family transporter